MYVPGHERLFRTIAGGSSGIDFGLLVVAADGGVMPQTREHLAILSLLGLNQGAIAISKADRADEARLRQLRDQLAQLEVGSLLEDMQVFCVSATAAGEPGVDALR